MLGSIFTSWYAFNKYYKLVDKTSAYTTALLLHPSLRKAYLTTAWKREWITSGVVRAKELWLQYKEEEVVVDNIDGSDKDYYER